MGVVIRTERLELRSLDHDAARAVLDGSPPPAVEWIEGYPLLSSRTAAAAVAAAGGEVPGSPFAAFQIVLRHVEQVIGDCGFASPPDSNGAVEVGYELAAAARGRGFESEALEALIGFAFTRDEVSCVRAWAPLEDEQARRVFENAGMMNVGEDSARAHFEA